MEAIQQLRTWQISDNIEAITPLEKAGKQKPNFFG